MGNEVCISFSHSLVMNLMSSSSVLVPGQDIDNLNWFWSSKLPYEKPSLWKIIDSCKQSAPDYSCSASRAFSSRKKFMALSRVGVVIIASDRSQGMSVKLLIHQGFRYRSTGPRRHTTGVRSRWRYQGFGLFC